jgi:hypothetical protein
MRISFHHQPEAQHPKSPAIYTPAGRLPHLWVCAVKRRRFPVGASPTRQPLQPEAIGAVMEVTKWLKPSITRPSGRAREEGGEEEAGSGAAEAACCSCKNSARRSGSTFPEASDTAHYCKAAGAHCTTGSRPSSHAAARRSGASAAACSACCTRRTARCPTGCTRTAACCSRSAGLAAAGHAGPAT